MSASNQQTGGGMQFGVEGIDDAFARQQILAANAGLDERVQQLRANATLPARAWIDVEEDTVYPAMDDRLVVFNDLRQRGLTLNVDIQDKAVEWHKQDYEATAVVAMDPEHRAEDENNVEYDIDGSPLPLIFSDFSLGFRDSGQDVPGQSVETHNADGAARVVAEAAEDLLLNGWEATIGGEDVNGRIDGYTMYGLTNHPSVHTGGLANWTTDLEEIRDDLQDMARDLKDDEFRPGSTGYLTYIGEALEDPINQPDPDGDGNLLVRDRLESLNSIAELRVSDQLDDDAVLMFRPTRDVVDLAMGLEEQVVEWESASGFRDHFKTIMGYTPRVKDTMRGQCGISYYTGGTS